MFGFLVAQATRWIKSIVAPKPAPKPKPAAPKPKPRSGGGIKPLPRIEFPKLLAVPGRNTIAPYWNNGRLTPKQQAANKAASANLAAIQRKNAAIAAENARRAAIRAKKQKQFNSAISHNRGVMKNMAAKWKKLFPKQKQVWDPSKDPTAKEGTDEFYKQVQSHYKWLASNNLNQQKKFKDQPGGWDNFFDAFGGQERREQGAREFASKQVGYLSTDQIKRYEKSAGSFTSAQAKKIQKLKALQSQGKLSQKEIDQYQAWEDSQIKTLKYMQYATQGSLEGYDAGSKAKLSTPLGQSLDWFSNSVAKPAGNLAAGLFKYTLGAGDKNAPSLVTAPSRLVNTIGNMLDQNREKYYHDQSKSAKKTTNLLEAWQASYNQRNLNIGNAKNTYDVNTDIDTSYKDALKIYKQKDKPNKFTKWYKGKLPTKDEWLNEEMYDYSTGTRVHAGGTTRKQAYFEGQGLEGRKRQADVANNTTEFLADPLFFAPGLGTIAKGSKVAAGASKATNYITKVGNTFAKTKIGSKVNDVKKWLNEEAKSPKQKYFEAAESANKIIDAAQAKYIPKMRMFSKQYAKEDATLKAKFDDSIIDEFKALADAGDDKAARWLQTMKNGEFSARAKIENFTRFGGVGSNPRLDKLQKLADNYAEFSEMQRKADGIAETATRFGKGKKNSFYSPRTKYFEDLDDYSFRMFKKNKSPQQAQDLYRGIVDRYMKSDVINYWGNSQKAKVAGLDAKINKTIAAYDAETLPARAAVEAAFKKTKTPYGRLRGFSDRYGPMALWKKSVLKYRPAWTVNNMIYNTQAAGLAAGAGGIVRQAKYFKPGAFKKDIADVPDAVRSQVINEVGSKGDRLTRFYTRVEDVPRLAAFKELKSKGLTDEQAMKRVNRYLLQYRTKNWERPIKSVVPFYHFQKGVAKAAVAMPVDRPLAAKAYNEVDQYQNDQYNQDFEKLIPELKQYGYSDEDIAKFKEENAKYFKGRLKVGDQYMTTPFNVFSEKGLGNIGLNPYLMAAAESASATDQYGQPIAGEEAGFLSRLRSKFPQLELGKKWLDASAVASGAVKPRKAWISTPGSLGYGMTKEQQGFDSSKTNYRESMDPRAGLEDDIMAFFGKPRGMKFDTKRFLETKKVAAIAEEYFAIPKDLEYEDRMKREQKLFKKFGVTSTEFYDGILSKNDSEFTKGVKKMRDEARVQDQELYDWYNGLPAGTRNVEATKKLRELVEQQYFANNPYHKYKFDWMTSDSVARADRQIAKLDSGGKWVKVGNRLMVKSAKQLAYESAKATGNWDQYNKAYGRPFSQKRADYIEAKRSGKWQTYTSRYGKSAKRLAYEAAKASGDWSEFQAQYGDQRDFDPKKVAEAKFWEKYTNATIEERQRLMKDNPQYDKRKDWTQEQWDEAKAKKKAKTLENTKFRKYFEASKKTISGSLPGTSTGRQRSIKFVLK